MSANIYWRPSTQNNKSLNVPAPSSFQERMREVGLSMPCTVEQCHVPVLKGLAAGYGREKDRPNPFDQILDLLDKHDAVELWAEY